MSTKLRDCLEEIENGMVFDCEDGRIVNIDSEGAYICKFLNGKTEMSLNKDWLDQKGHIIPAKKQQMTAEEWARNDYEETMRTGMGLTRHSIDLRVHAFKAGEQNRDILYDDLIEAATAVAEKLGETEYGLNPCYGEWSKLDDALAKIKEARDDNR